MSFNFALAQYLMVALIMVLIASSLAATRGRLGMLPVAVGALTFGAFIATWALIYPDQNATWIHVGAAGAFGILVFFLLTKLARKLK